MTAVCVSHLQLSMTPSNVDSPGGYHVTLVNGANSPPGGTRPLDFSVPVRVGFKERRLLAAATASCTASSRGGPVNVAGCKEKHNCQVSSHSHIHPAPPPLSCLLSQASGGGSSSRVSCKSPQDCDTIPSSPDRGAAFPSHRTQAVVPLAALSQLPSTSPCALLPAPSAVRSHTNRAADAEDSPDHPGPLP